MTTLGTGSIIWNLIDFIVLIVFLWYVASKPVSRMVREKQEKISTTISNVEERLSQVNKKLDSQASQLEEIKKEIKKIEEQAEMMSKKLHEDIIKSAHDEAEKVRAQIKKSMEQDINRTKADLRKEVVDKALARAHELVNQKLDKNTQMKLIESFALSLDNKNSNN
jgi:F-type H+-transporting ATPase subunit b